MEGLIDRSRGFRTTAGTHRLTLVTTVTLAASCAPTHAGPITPTAALEQLLDSTRVLADQISVRGGRWVPGEPWVFASYRIGGFDNLNELLHETGHAVHIAAIRARPAWHDWPDSDTFTEAIAELATQEMFEPEWQEALLGGAAPLDESLRAKYAGIMMDATWALFEFRVHRPDAPSPNAIWTDLTSRYLRIKPHPEWSWWAMRGQLVESPGYLLNYALGAVIAADLRRALARRFGPIATGRNGWYREVSDAVFRYGLERSSKDVVSDILGRPPNPEALLEDLGRIRTPRRRRRGRGRP